MTFAPWFVAPIMSLIALAPHDSEWPPQEDPYSSSTNPTSSSPLFMEQIIVPIPAEFKPWFTKNHWHTSGVGGFTGSFAIGDLEGQNDGDLDIVLYTPDEAALAMRLSIDWSAKTAQSTPLWFWMTPRSLDSTNGFGLTDSSTLPASGHAGSSERNVVIWDMNGDGTNEVALVASRWGTNVPPAGTSKWNDAIFILRTDNSMPAGVTSSIREPQLVADSGGYPTHSVYAVGDRLGVCKVRDTDSPMDLVSHSHEGQRIGIWKLDLDPQSGQEFLTLEYEYKFWGGSNATPGSQQLETHEFNYADIDGDGFDEFFLDGVVDFVGPGGVPTNSTEPTKGISNWVTAVSTPIDPNDHTDQMYAANWDGSGTLSIFGVPQMGHETFYNATTGAATENTNSPSTHGQSIYGGNWDGNLPGLEAIIVPKNYDGVVVGPPPASAFLAGAFAIDSAGNELAVDGTMFPDQSLSVPKRISSGPSKEIFQIDWDGDYSRDEILSIPWSCITVWEMNEKAQLGSPLPAGMPTRTQILSNPTPIVDPITSAQYSIYYYQGINGSMTSSWGWSNNGVGRYTHYYSKLAEMWPESNVPRARPLDLGNDHREEIVVLGPTKFDPTIDYTGLYIYFNPNALTGPAKTTPRVIPEYMKWRYDFNPYPFEYQSLPTLVDIDIFPDTAGMPLQSTVPVTDVFTAFANYDNGTRVDISSLVDWQETENLGYVDINGSNDLASGTSKGSARIFCTWQQDGVSIPSKPAYIFASDQLEPEVLMAGFSTTHLSNTSPYSDLVVEARIAHKDNVSMVGAVALNQSPSLLWSPLSAPLLLYDDGQSGHGDALAGDGIYSGKVTALSSAANNFNTGDNLFQIGAAPISSTSTVSALLPSLGVGQMPGPITPINLINYDTDAYAEGDMPRVRMAGYRGIPASVNGPWMVECEVIAPSNSPGASLDVYATVQATTNQTVALTNYGNGRYGLPLSQAPQLASGVYFVDVQAVANAGLSSEAKSDAWPFLRLHP